MNEKRASTQYMFARGSRQAFGQDFPLRKFTVRRPADAEYDPERHVVGPVCIAAGIVFAILVATGLA